MANTNSEQQNKPNSDLEARVAELEGKLQQLRRDFDALQQGLVQGSPTQTGNI